jgi:hypothetical protein
MFTPEDRTRLREALLDAASTDERISGAAITGSASEDREDRWSDIDLAFGIRSGYDLQAALADWSARMYKQYGALHHVDVHAGAWTYRVFLLAGTLQVDLAFVPQDEFRPLAPTFRLVFGKALEPRTSSPTEPEAIIGLAWLHALHAKSSIARGRLWQAEYMVSGVRDHVLSLACLRHRLSIYHGRGLDQLPREILTRYEESLVGRASADELSRALGVVVRGLIFEVHSVNVELAKRLEGPLTELISLRESS